MCNASSQTNQLLVRALCKHHTYVELLHFRASRSNSTHASSASPSASKSSSSVCQCTPFELSNDSCDLVIAVVAHRLVAVHHSGLLSVGIARTTDPVLIPLVAIIGLWQRGATVQVRAYVACILVCVCVCALLLVSVTTTPVVVVVAAAATVAGHFPVRCSTIARVPGRPQESIVVSHVRSFSSKRAPVAGRRARRPAHSQWPIVERRMTLFA